MKKILKLLLILAITSCANPFRDFYEGMTVNEVNQINGITQKTEPIFNKSNISNIKQDEENLYSNRYIKVGASSFNGADVDTNDALEYAKEINADLVMLYVTYTNTINTMTPIMSPNFTNINTTYYNNYGGYLGNSQSTIQGTSTTYVPTSIHRYDYLATYWKKNNNKYKIGIIFDNLPQEVKQKYKTNKGIIVVVVVNDTPAFKNDILQGDVIIKINGKTIYNKETAQEIMDNLQNKTKIVLTIIRDGKNITKQFKTD